MMKLSQIKYSASEIGASLVETGLLVSLIALISILAVRQTGISTDCSSWAANVPFQFNGSYVNAPGCNMYMPRCRVIPCGDVLDRAIRQVKINCRNDYYRSVCYK